jgi:hypothetical protein
MSSKLSFLASWGVNGFTSLVCIAASVGFVARAGASDLDGLAAKGSAGNARPYLPSHHADRRDQRFRAIRPERAPYAGAIPTSLSLISPFNGSPQWVFAPAKRMAMQFDSLS